jgi:hypothetical protein
LARQARAVAALGPLFEAALSLPEADRWPFEHARVHLAYGEWLRRTRDTARARLYLRAALDTLVRLGARPWAERPATSYAPPGSPPLPSPVPRRPC